MVGADCQVRYIFAMGWRLLGATGLRRGEALSLRWRDVDLDGGRLAVRRSVGVVKAKGAGERLVEGPTKTGRASSSP
jgi:integrase